MFRRWYLRDFILLIIYIAVLYGAWVALEYAAVYWPSMRYYNRILVMMGINITLAVSLNIINGHAGQFSLGHAGFMAVGAYSAAYLSVYYFGPYVAKMPDGSAQQIVWQNLLLIVAVLAGGLMSAIAGYIVGLPSLRLRGDYLAIVTLGFGEIIRVLILNIEAIGAARGLSGIPAWSSFFWVFFFCGLTILISNRLVSSSVGRAFLAIREDQIAAESMGIDTTRYKVKAFIIGSCLAGVAGGLFAHYTPAYLNPTGFTFIRSFEVVAMVVLGGLGSISGSIVAAIILTLLPEALRPVKDYMPGGRDPRMVIYSIMLIVLMLTRPQGLFGRKELWQFLPRRKDSLPNEARDEGNADDKLDRDAAPPVT
ncbi:MAG: branched-chain amino acid ABC transporter permease [Acidobacteria bacterium]|nr:branched-chain amino acid ABC transporter permease [Acidobacteriota bacterium]MBV9478368.1 branched-chain amino acid ABC transporter permease [Acidobacteriota bacterium]